MAEAWSGNWCLINPGMAAPAIPMPSPIRTMPPYRPATPSQLRQKIPATARSWNQKMIFHGVIQRATRGEMGAATPSTNTGSKANNPEFSRESPISFSIVPNRGSGESNPVRRLKQTIRKAASNSILPFIIPEESVLSIPYYTASPPLAFKTRFPAGNPFLPAAGERKPPFLLPVQHYGNSRILFKIRIILLTLIPSPITRRYVYFTFIS